MKEFALTVALEGSPIGELTLRGDEPELHYSDAYRANPTATTLSASMPRAEASHRGEIPNAWLWGLLPDNEHVLRRWAQDYDASLSTPVSLLSTEIGLDCAGAVQFYASGDGERGRPRQRCAVA